MRKKPVFILELDYDANPDLDPTQVRQDLAEEIGTSTINGTRLTLSLDEAFRVRMRFDENVTSIEKVKT
jgi:hypothetical protein